MIIPYHVDVPMSRVPWMNWALIALTVVCYPVGLRGLTEVLVMTLLDMPDAFEPSAAASLVLGGPSALGRVAHVFVHADLFHLLGNMIFLWVFGNAVCAKVGNAAYAPLYLTLGLLSGSLAYAIDPRPAVGASGAINGIVGMFLAWYLSNEISCFYALGFRLGTFSVRSLWMILMWLAFDIWGVVSDPHGSVGYVAHLSGFTLGLGAAIAMQSFGVVEMEPGEESLLHVLGYGEEPKKRVKAVKRRGGPVTPRTDAPAADKPGTRPAFAALLPEAPFLDAGLVRKQVGKALGTELPADAVTGDDPAVTVAYRGRKFRVRAGDGAWPGGDGYPDHGGWLTVEQVAKGPTADGRDGLWYVGRLLAALAPDDAVAAVWPAKRAVKPWSDGVVRRLEGADPREAFGERARE